MSLDYGSYGSLGFTGGNPYLFNPVTGSQWGTIDDPTGSPPISGGGGINIGGKSPEDLLSILEQEGEAALVDVLMEIGMDGKTARTLAAVAGELGKDGIDQVLGISSGSNTSGSVPAGVPDRPVTSSPVAGTVWDNANRVQGTGLELHAGLYNFDDLDPEGLHDAIQAVKVRDGWEVTLHKDVDGGAPGGQSLTIAGPKTLTSAQQELEGLAGKISAISVRPLPENGGSNGSDDEDDTSGGASTVAVAGIAAALYFFFA